MPAEGLMPPPPAERLHLPSVTLCAVSSVNMVATLEAMRVSMQYVDFAGAILCTDATDVIRDAGDAIRIVPIERLTSAKAYSQFMLTELVDHITTDHCLVIQWDGHVIDPARWRPEFLDYDYVGASWPQFDDGHDVGNGGFSLRSRRLMEACLVQEFTAHHPEDVAIGRTNRAFLESRGIRFAPRPVADQFAAERAGDPARSFGYHGAFLMPQVLGAERFWGIYRTLNQRSSLRRDYGALRKALCSGENTIIRYPIMLRHRWGDGVVRFIQRLTRQ